MKKIIILFVLLLTKELFAGDPTLAKYRYGGCQIFWFVQISDTHINTTNLPRERLRWIVTDLLNIVEPLLIVNTGDLVDGTEGGLIPDKAPSIREWTEYRDVVDTAGMTFDIYIDVVGNHDHYNDPGNTYYLFYSVAGRYDNSTQHSVRYEFPFGVYHFFFADTTANDDRPWPWDCTEMSPQELDFMRQELANNSDANLTFIFGHHSYNEVGYTGSFCYLPDEQNEDRGHTEFIDLIQSSNAFYFHGHNHETIIYEDHNIITFEVNSLGKSGDYSEFAIYAVDNDSLSVGYGKIIDPWPTIVITAPSGINYAEDVPNPYAYPVETGCSDNPVRALVFDEQPVQVWFKIDNGNWNTMFPHPEIPHLFYGSFDGSELSPGEHTLTVEVAGTKLRDRTIRFNVIDGPCTIEEEEHGCNIGGDGDSDGDSDGGLDITEDITSDIEEDIYDIYDIDIDSYDIELDPKDIEKESFDIKEDILDITKDNRLDYEEEPSVENKGGGCSCRI